MNVSEELEAENEKHASPDGESNNVETPIAAENEESARPDTCGFDVGTLWNRNRSIDSSVRELAVRNGRIPPNAQLLPRDSTRRPFPTVILQKVMQNGEFQDRDWLTWGPSLSSLFCFPCRLFANLKDKSLSILAIERGWESTGSWRKLYDKIPCHEASHSHKIHYIEWKELQRRLLSFTTVVHLEESRIRQESFHWRQILRRIISVVFFLSERGLAFRGSSQRLGDPSNGNFLGLIELLSQYNPTLARHIEKIK